MIETEVVSVNIDWGALDYNYELGDWNPDNHTYENGGWEATTENGDHITVTNTGNTEVTVHFDYQSVSGLEEVTGSLKTLIFSLPAPDDSTESKQIVIFTPADDRKKLFESEIGTDYRHHRRQTVNGKPIVRANLPEAELSS